MKKRLILFCIVMGIIASATAYSLYTRQKEYEKQISMITPTPQPVIAQETGEKLIEDDDRIESGEKISEIIRTDESTYTNRILYTSNGFKPNEISIQKGTVVTWENTSEKQLWVVSIENGRTEERVDQQGIAEKGGTYSYTFSTPGVWKYKNRLSDGDEGIINVEN